MDHAHHSHDMSSTMAAPMRCKMNMLWNTDIIQTCIVFRSWQITSYTIFVFSLLAIVALSILHEYLRIFQRKLDYHIALSLSARNRTGRGTSTRSRDHSNDRSDSDSGNVEEAGLLSGRTTKRLLSASMTGTPVPPAPRLLRAVIYGLTVFLSFFLMLVFMTYNAYLIAAVVVGASIGHYIFGSTINIDMILNDPSTGKGMACH